MYKTRRASSWLSYKFKFSALVQVVTAGILKPELLTGEQSTWYEHASVSEKVSRLKVIQVCAHSKITVNWYQSKIHFKILSDLLRENGVFRN
jgi:hypothetical protein